MGIIDTHSHVMCTDLRTDIDAIVERAKSVNISRILIVCTSLEEGKLAIETAKQYDLFDVAIGFHPEDADTITETELAELKILLADSHVVALGEIGLDYYWRQDNKEAQKKLFIDQIKLANELNLPILIHMREATSDTLEILKTYPSKGIMHCYSGSVETANILLKLGYYLSFAGPLTFKNAKDAPLVVANTPLNRLFVETDAPYLTPHPFRGKRNEPYYVHVTFDKVCEIKQMDPNDVMQQMEENYAVLFNKKIEDKN